MPQSLDNIVLTQSCAWQRQTLEQLTAPQDETLLLVAVNLVNSGISTLNDKTRECAIRELSPVQAQRYAKRDALHQASYLASRYYLRGLLSHLSGLIRKDIVFAHNPWGKPILDAGSVSLEFNFSDTSGGADARHSSIGFYAFSASTAVGVDVEHPQRKARWQSIAAKRFTPLEQAYCSHNNKFSVARAIHLWTRKEALGKAIGVGINFKMRETDVLGADPFQALSQPYVVPCKDQDWCLHQIAGPNHEVVCVAHAGAAPLRICAVQLIN